MTELEMRLAIAEACGWTRIGKSQTGVSAFSKWDWMGTPRGDADKPRDEQSHKVIPDYPNDLNAMHEAEKTLDTEKNILPEDVGEETEHQAYYCELERVVARDCCEEEIYWHTVHATARQRCEAFLRTKGLWKDER